MKTPQREQRSDYLARRESMGSEGSSGQKQGHGADRLRPSGNAQEGARPVREDAAERRWRPKVSGQTQATKRPQEASTPQDTLGPTTGSNQSSAGPRVPGTVQAGEAGAPAQTTEGAGTKPTPKVDGSASEVEGPMIPLWQPAKAKSEREFTHKDRKEFSDTLDGLGLTEEERKSGWMLLIGLVVGSNADRVAKLAGLNRDTEARPRAKRFRECGIWRPGGVTACDWENEETGEVEFLMDILCGEGVAVRTLVNGKPGYKLRPGYKIGDGKAA